MKSNSKGISAAILSALFLGLAPVFGKQAMLLGLSPLAVVAIRTVLATFLLFVVILLFYRPFLYIYPAGLLGCLIAGWTNGIGSLFYYSAIGRLDASLGQLLYSLYPLFLVVWLSLDNQPPNRLTLMRIFLIVPALFMLLQVQGASIDMIGVAQMLIGSALYALHLPINQRVLRDMPAPTVTLYTLLAMSAVVLPTFLFSNPGITVQMNSAEWIAALRQFGGPILGLTLVTFLSRVMLFVGVKHLGGMQTAFLGLGETLVTIFFAHLWLGERLSSLQWLGAVLLLFSLSLVSFEKSAQKHQNAGGFLNWLQPNSLPGETWRPPK